MIKMGLKKFLSCLGKGDSEDKDEVDAEELERQVARRNSQVISRQLKKERKQYEGTYRLLLLGAGESGKSTIVKQMKILHNNGFTDEERRNMVNDIKKNIQDAILTIANALDKITPPVSLEHAENQGKINWLQENATKPDFEYPSQFYEYVESLWKDRGIQQAHERSNEYQLIDCAKYFLDKVREVRSVHYFPSDQDMLRCRALTTNIVETRFQVKKVNFHIFDVGGQREERKKWIQCFHDVTAIIFVTSCSSYNMMLTEDTKVNRLRESLRLFHQLWTNRWICTRSFILFLNKVDILSEKIRAGKSKMVDYFPEFAHFPYRVRREDKCENFDEPSEVVRVMHFIRNEFLKLAAPTLTVKLRNGNEKEHSVYPHFTCAVDTKIMKRVFDDCKDIVQRIHMHDFNIL